MWNRGSLLKVRRGTEAVVAAVVLSACTAELLVTDVDGETVDAGLCSLDPTLLHSTLSPNAIPAMTEPDMVDPTSTLAGYLEDDDRVLGLVVEGEARAYPHKIFWWHEIVNDRIGDTWVSVSFCPLTGSGLAFDPRLPEGRLDLGVSGLLFANNLVMYDRVTSDLYGPQLAVAGKCGRFRDVSLELVPVQEMGWARWQALHPDTKVVAGDQGYNLNYQFYPYGDYDQLNNTDLLFSMTVDTSRPIKELVLAIRVGSRGRGYPFGELAEVGNVVAINELVGGTPTVVFYEAAYGEAALAFDARVNGQTLTFDADPGGFWTDQETGSTWTLDGTATAGPLTGERLATRADAYTLFWFAWRHFQPDGTTFPN